MAAPKLEPEKRRYVLARLAVGTSAAALQRELANDGIQVAQSTVRAWRNRAKKKGELEEVRKNLAVSFPEFDKDARIVGRNVDLDRIQRRLEAPGNMKSEEFIRHVNMANKIRDSIARDVTDGFGSAKISQQTNIGGKNFEDRMHKEHEEGPAWRQIDRVVVPATIPVNPDSDNGDRQEDKREESAGGDAPTTKD